MRTTLPSPLRFSYLAWLFFLAAFFAVLTVSRARANETLAIRVGPADKKEFLHLVPGSSEVFRDCQGKYRCPAMVVLPTSGATGFAIGSPESEAGRADSESMHDRSVKAFALGKYEVSVGEYMTCVEAKACRHPEWAEPDGQHNVFTGTGVTYRSIKAFITEKEQPVVGVSWQDAADYAAWLSGLTGELYRLPSETEWEYAARAGTKTAYWWGDTARLGGKTMACCADCGSEHDATGLYDVKSFEPNPWGLHNVHGNVWEWVADYFCHSYAAAPNDGRAKVTKACPKQKSPEGLRVFRGGSCFYEPRQMRSAMRLRNWPRFRNMTVGFRIARSIRVKSEGSD